MLLASSLFIVLLSGFAHARHANLFEGLSSTRPSSSADAMRGPTPIDLA
jgi:hypothetical protein